MSNDEKEMVRQATMEVLAACHPVPRNVKGLRRAVATEVPFAVSDQDVAGALAFLESQGKAESEPDPVGSTLWWRATADGILAVERAGQ